jgi:uncharacterized repeat protein (TIGR01451 family)
MLLVLVPATASAQFTKVTTESGLAAIVSAQYQQEPDWWLSGLHFVDLDGDGDLDLFLSQHGDGTAVATINDGAGHFTRAVGTYPQSEIHLHYDGDEDGRTDLSMTHEDGGGRWWRNASTASALNFVATGVIRGGNTARSQVLVDLNRDGKVDWLRGAPPGLQVDFGDGALGFTEGSLSLAIPGTGSNENANFLPADLDGDGDMDLLALVGGGYDDTPGRTIVYRNQGSLSFVDATAASGLPVNATLVKGLGDFDQDGDVDLIAVASKSMPPVVYLNNGAGVFTLKPNAISGVAAQGLTYSAWGTAVTTDFDNDGVVDILMNGKYYLKLLRGTGGGSFTYMNGAWGIFDTCACSVDDGLAFGDIDGDGDLDVVGYHDTFPIRTIDLYRNDLPPRRFIRVRPVGLAGNRGAAGAKIRVFAPGTNALLWYEQVAIYCFQAANSYYGHALTERHFGLGARPSVDVEVEFYPSGTRVRRNGVAADTTVTVDEGGVVTLQSDVSVSVTDQPDPVGAGHRLTYSLLARNAGPSAATSVSLTQILDPRVTLVSTQPACSGTSTLTCPLPDLPAGATASASVVVDVPASLVAPATLAHVVSIDAAEPDPVAANNSATETTAVIEPALGELSHGSLWWLDLAPGPGPTAARHRFRFRQEPHSSYEVVLDGASGDLGGSGPRLERVTPGGTVLQPSQPTGIGFSRTLRFRNDTGSVLDDQLVRVSSDGCTTDCDAADTYRLRVYDTTLAAPRFNNASGQVTFLLVQNRGAVSVSVTAWYWSPAGALLGQQTFSLPPRGSISLNTSSTVPNASGSLTLTHDAPYGGVTGKAVSVDLTLGSAFDTPLLPRAR